MGELRKVIFLITVFGGLLLRGLPASAQVGEQSSLEERMSAIEQQLRKLESRLEALEGAASGATVVQAGNGSEQGTPSAAIGDRLADLDQKLRIVERKRELEQEAEMERAKTVPVLRARKGSSFDPPTEHSHSTCAERCRRTRVFLPALRLWVRVRSYPTKCGQRLNGFYLRISACG